MPEATPFYLWGTAQSGKSWLKRLLCEHPDIAGLDEPHLTDTLFPSIVRCINKYNNDNLEKKEISLRSSVNNINIKLVIRHLYKEIISNYSHSMSKHGNINWIGDDTPDTLHAAQFCADTFPEAKFLLVIRDGRDAMAASWYAETKKSPPLIYELCKTAEEYAPRYAEAWCHVMDTAKRFNEQNPNRLLEVRYEDLAADPVTVVRFVLTHFGLPVSEDTAAGYCGQTGMVRNGAVWHREPSDDQERVRLGQPGIWQEFLPPAAVDAFMQRAGDLLASLGYA